MEFPLRPDDAAPATLPMVGPPPIALRTIGFRLPCREILVCFEGWSALQAETAGVPHYEHPNVPGMRIVAYILDAETGERFDPFSVSGGADGLNCPAGIRSPSAARPSVASSR